MPILGAFERSTDDAVGVTSRFDTSPDDGSRLTGEIITSSPPPPCDVVWNPGVLETIRLQKRGLLESRRWPVPAGWPSGCIASDGTWCGFAATARVILVNTRLLDDPAMYPNSVLDLVNDQWQGKCAIGHPAIGKTATHFAVLRDQLGHQSVIELLRRIKDSALVLGGSRQVAIAVSAGQVAWGVTDSDSAIREVELRHPVAIVFPDQGPSQLGTLRIPSTCAVLRGAKHHVSAGLLADYLVNPATEDRLAMGNGSELPLHRESKFPARVLAGTTVRWMDANFETAAENEERWQADVKTMFESP